MGKQEQPTGGSILLAALALPTGFLDDESRFPGIERSLRHIETLKVAKELQEATKFYQHQVPLVSELCLLVYEAGANGLPYDQLLKNLRNTADRMRKQGFLVLDKERHLHFRPLAEALIEHDGSYTDLFQQCRKNLERIRACPPQEEGQAVVSTFKSEYGGLIGRELEAGFKAVWETLDAPKLIDYFERRRLIPRAEWMNHGQGHDLMSSFRSFIVRAFCGGKKGGRLAQFEEALNKRGAIAEYMTADRNSTAVCFSKAASEILLLGARQFGEVYAKQLHGSIASYEDGISGPGIITVYGGTYSGRGNAFVAIKGTYLRESTLSEFERIANETAQKLLALPEKEQ